MPNFDEANHITKLQHMPHVIIYNLNRLVWGKIIIIVKGRNKVINFVSLNVFLKMWKWNYN